MGSKCSKINGLAGPLPEPLENPPRAGCGRERSAPIPLHVNLEESNPSLHEYASRKKDTLLVYRCAGCGVRFGNEVDICRQASLERGVLAVTFTQTFNLYVKDDDVCCVHCDKIICDYDKKDERLLTLPLFHKDGTWTMQKGPLSLLCIVNTVDDPCFPNLTELQQIFPEKFEDENGDAYSFELVETTFWKVGEHVSLEGTICAPNPDATPTIFDFVLGVNIVEEVNVFRFAWACSGGNILLYETEKDSTELWEQLHVDGHIINAKEWDTLSDQPNDPNITNPPFPPNARIAPKELVNSIRKAARGRLLYPRWLTKPYLPSCSGEELSKNRHDGRCRRLWKGEIEDTGAVEYLTAITGKLQVYRCPTCGCRIANETEICRPASWERKQFAATFNRTFSLTVKDENVCCIRCGTNLYPNDSCDPSLLTVPLYWDGQRTLQKSPLRLVLFANPWHLLQTVNEEGDQSQANVGFAQRIGSLESCLEEFVPEGWAVDATFLVRVFRAWVETPREVELNTRPLLEKYGHFSTVVQAWRDAGVGPNYKFVPYFEEESTLASLPAQDVGIYVRVLFDYSMYCSWTDYGGLDWESSLLGMWMACGGNLVFADWFASKGVPRKHHKDPSRLDLERRAIRFETSEWWYNRQPSYAQLLRDQHYMGWWPADQAPPPFILGRMRRAALFRQVYPQWLFLRDFPAATFDSLVRQEHDKRRNGCIDEDLFKESPPYAARARDAVYPD